MAKANPISSSQAFNQAKAFLSSKGIALEKSDATFQQPRMSKAKDDSYYYVFNVGNDHGFVIVSGDDRMEPILGYADEGSFDDTNLPEFMKCWLQGYEREIDAVQETPNFKNKKRAIEKTKRAIAPMITTKWGHGYPYNSKTPVYNGKNAPVGCSPAILAQFLYYYRDKLGNTIQTTIPAYSSNDVLLEAIDSGTMIDWDNMLDQYLFNSGYTTTQVDAVSNLMLFSGQAMSAIYSASETLTTTKSFITALVDYFGFDNSIAYVDREYYSDEEWEDVIYHELAEQRPVSYYAFSQSAGHNLLVDGYDGSGLYHINWGWDGKYNGYFRLPVLNRYKAGNNTQVDASSYAIDHSALLFVSHSSDGSVNTANHRLSAKVNTASGSTINCQFANQSGFGGSYYYGLGYVDDEGNMVFLKEFNIRHTPASLGNRSSTSRTFGLSASDFEAQGLGFGAYKVVPIYELNGENVWRECQHESFSYALVNYSASGIAASRNDLLSNLSVSEFDFYGNGLNNSEQIVRATIVNQSSEEDFVGDVYLFASTTSTIGSSLSYARVNLGRNGEVTVDLPFTPSESETYTIWVATDETCSDVIGKTTISINNATLTPIKITKNNADFSFERNYAGVINKIHSVYGNTLTVKFFNIINPNAFPVPMSFTVWLREWDSMTATSWNYNPQFTTYGDNAISQIVDVIIPANDTIEIPLEFKELKYGTKYDLRLEERGKTSTNFFNTPAFTFLPAVISWYADGTNTAVAPTETVVIDDNAVAVDITDVTGISTVEPSANPNVLYYLGETQDVPAGLNDRNVVKGKTADKVLLRDGYPFYILKSFTADEINFTTVPTKGAVARTSLGWNTISLPFDVTSVRNTTDDVDIDWFHSDEETGKNFWVRNFDSYDTDEGEVYFKNVERMYAYEPYIFNVPGSYWGNKWNLVNKEITFCGENALLHQYAHMAAGSREFDFLGTTIGKSVTNAYVLNEEGDMFIYRPTARNVPAFHGYFVFNNDKFHFTSGYDKQPLRIKCVDDDMVDAIMMPFTTNDSKTDIYNLHGMKVSSNKQQNGMLDIESLPNGIYIVNGKKMIISHNR